MINRIGRKAFVVAVLLSVGLVAEASAQIYRYYSPGSVWTVTAIRVKPGFEQAYRAYLDGELKKADEANIKAGYQKSFKILETLGTNADSWNLLILREYKDLASMEANREKEDALAQQVVGDDQKQMQGYDDRSKIRDVIGVTYTRELLLK